MAGRGLCLTEIRVSQENKRGVRWYEIQSVKCQIFSGVKCPWCEEGGGCSISFKPYSLFATRHQAPIAMAEKKKEEKKFAELGLTCGDAH